MEGMRGRAPGNARGARAAPKKRPHGPSFG